MKVARNKSHLTKLLTQLDKAKRKENYLEVILIGNVLIREQVKFIYESMLKKPASSPTKKFSLLLSDIIDQPVVIGGSSVKIAAKKNIKAVKVWKAKFDAFFKSLKHELPSGQKALAEETLKIAAMLQTTLTKC